MSTSYSPNHPFTTRLREKHRAADADTMDGFAAFSTIDASSNDLLVLARNHSNTQMIMLGIRLGIDLDETGKRNTRKQTATKFMIAKLDFCCSWEKKAFSWKWDTTEYVC